MKTLLISTLLICGLVYAGTVVEIPAHQQNIKLTRVLISLPGKNIAKVIAYFSGAQGKLPPREISKEAIGNDEVILAYYIKKISAVDIALQGYEIAGEISDWDTSSLTVTEKIATEGEGEEAISIKTITIRQVL